jgi:uncharacterized protein YndB with AHSA1/START domain
MNKSTFVYVAYIRTSAERLWSALTTPEFIQQYWFGMRCESSWTEGSPWKLLFEDGRVADKGEIIAAEPPRRLVIKWHNEWKPEFKAEGDSLCTFDIEAVPDVPSAVKLSITHSMARQDSKFIEGVSGGWPRIVSNLKSLLETGAVALTSTGKTK